MNWQNQYSTSNKEKSIYQAKHIVNKYIVDLYEYYLHIEKVYEFVVQILMDQIQSFDKL